jgi:hypothetical protein
MMNKKHFLVEGRARIRAYSLAEAHQKFTELVTRNPLLNTPVNRLGDPTYQEQDRSNVYEMVRIRELTEQEVHDLEPTDGPPEEY